MAPLGCGGRRKRPAKFFMTMCLIWHSINKSVCKVELNFDNFSGRNFCFDATCLIIFHYFTLAWKWRFFRVNETTWNAFTTGSLKKGKSTKSACIDHNAFACCFSRLFERCDVIVTHYLMKVKRFSFYTLPKLAFYSDSIGCILWFCSGWIKSCFIKMVMAHKTHLISFKILMMKSKDRKCYMCSKFRINPPYIVYVINNIWYMYSTTLDTRLKTRGRKKTD